MDGTNEHYHNDFSSISKTMLSCYHTSVADFHRYYVARIAKPPQPKASVIGSIAHTVLLDGRQLDDVACVYPQECLKSNGAINPKPSNEWIATLEPWQYPVKQKVREQVAAMLGEIRKHEVVSLVESATAREHPVYWHDESSGLDCRMRADFFHDMDEYAICYDLKFTAQIYAFPNVMRSFKYWMQDAHYSRGLGQHLGKPVKFVFFAIQDTPPFQVFRYEYDQLSRETYAAKTCKLLRELAERYQTNDWVDERAKKTNYVSAKPWEFEEEDDNLNWEGIEEETEPAKPF